LFQVCNLNTLHKGDNKGYYYYFYANNNNNNNNNNNKTFTEVRTASEGLWQSPSPHLSTCDLCLWEYMEGKVYESNPYTLDELRKNIRSVVETIEVTFLLKVYLNMTTRAQKCTDLQGSHFQHLLYECAFSLGKTKRNYILS
jgi:hypothetical protein